MAKPPLSATLAWQGDLRFVAKTERTEIILDSAAVAGPSPPEALAMALAACMAMDVAYVVNKGRHDLSALEARITGTRQDEIPHHFVRFTMHFTVTGDVPDHTVERAINLSREKYCSVWHSLRQDIELETSFEVRP